MATKRITVHCVEIEDKPGSLQRFLAQTAAANVDLSCFAVFSAGGGRGKVYVSAKKPDAFKTFLKSTGIKATDAAGFIIDGADKVGAASGALKGLAAAKISGVAGAAMVCNGQYHMLLVVNAADGDAAEKALKA